MTVKSTGDETAGAFTLLEAYEPPDCGPPMHIHHDCAQAFYVLDGEYLMFVGDREQACPAGSFIYIPAQTPHGFRVGKLASRKLNLYIPAGMVGYFDDLSAAIKKVRQTSSTDPYCGRVVGGGHRTCTGGLSVDGRCADGARLSTRGRQQ